MLHSGVQIWPAFSFTIDFRDLPVILTAGAVMTAAQIFLARRERWWPGLVLPLFWLLWTLADILPQLVRFAEGGYGWFGSMVDMGLPALALENIPTLLLLGICAVCRPLRRRRRKKQLKKARIDDI